MSQLRESVIVKTAWDGQELKGELTVESDGLPGLTVEYGAFPTYRPWTIPTAWTIRASNGSLDGVLLETWNASMYLRDQIACAQREADTVPPCPDCGLPLPCPCIDALPGEEQPTERCDIEQYKAEAEARGER